MTRKAPKFPVVSWSNASHGHPFSYDCGFCNHRVASATGFESDRGLFIRICPACCLPTFFGEGQVPGAATGREVDHLPADIEAVYVEARRAAASGAHTASVLACRKLLMHIGVNCGAEPGKSFIFYIDHLATTGHIPPNGKAWVDLIRARGNEATHEIVIMTKDDSGQLIRFAEMLLRFIYEFPNSVGPA